jgi:hypothetical protein
MTKQIVRDSGAPAPMAHYCQGVVVGNHIYAAGQIASDYLWLLKTPKGRKRLEIFASPPYRRGHAHNSFRLRFPCRFRKLDSCVSMMQSAQDRMCDDVPEAVDRAPVRRITHG